MVRLSNQDRGVANPQASAKAYSSATSAKRSKRPDAPPCPAPILVLSRTGPPPVIVARRPRHPFGGLPIGHARIGQARQSKDRRIGLGHDIVVRRVALDRGKGRGIEDRIAPFEHIPAGSAANRRRASCSAHRRTARSRRSRQRGSGARLAIAPITIPPALPPHATMRPSAVKFCAIRCRAQARKSENVLGFRASFPLRYQCQPLSVPPRTWAKA